MKRLLLLICLLPAFNCLAQNTRVKCRDIVKLHAGVVLEGTILHYDPDTELVIHTRNQLVMHIPSNNVRKIVQKCRTIKVRDSVPATLEAFRERGWYHFTRFETLPGRNAFGFGLQHSSGFKFNRMASLGIGVGAEELNGANSEVSTYPVFGEFRGYLLARKTTPYYAIAFGHGFSSKLVTDQRFLDGPLRSWKGGPMLQSEIGCRLGSHAMIQFGIRFQKTTLYWQQFWGGISGKDVTWHKRYEIVFGLLI